MRFISFVLLFHQESDGGGSSENGAESGEVQPEQDVRRDQLPGGEADHRRSGDGGHQAGVPEEGREAEAHAEQDPGDVHPLPGRPGHHGETAGRLQNEKGEYRKKSSFRRRCLEIHKQQLAELQQQVNDSQAVCSIPRATQKEVTDLTFDQLLHIDISPKNLLQLLSLITLWKASQNACAYFM
ncbi:hypothetical protein CEXT_401261 [Caerostris extrusa]|uniref:Uncharacterized protein n=1 Tax=Caerostris extrusa TaxID=172846 RepID=A0AAV4VPZ6_CAEEX|nr:hypothetical protein CEXT_401261 [Caerostris extrusa]